MFTYQHYRSDLYESQIQTYSYFEDVSPISSVVESTRGTTEHSRLTAGSYQEQTIISGTYHVPSITGDVAYDVTVATTERIVYATTVLTQGATVYSYTAETTTYSEENPPFSTNPAVTSGSTQTVLTAAPPASSSGSGSRTYTMPATQTYSFTTHYFSNTVTTLSASASATRTTTGSRTLTQTAGVITVPAVVPPKFCETRNYIGRGNPPPLRPVNSGYAITSVQSGTAWAGGTSGEQTWESSRFSTKTSTSSTLVQSTQGGVGGDAVTETFSTEHTFISITAVTTTSLRAEASAQRPFFSTDVFFNTRTSSSGVMARDGSSQFLTPTITGDSDFSAFVPIGSQVWMRNIFTDAKEYQDSFSISTSSARLQWSFLSSSWRFLATLSNNTTSTTTEFIINSHSAANTTMVDATHGVGVTTAVLGPLVPFISSLRSLSVSLSDTASSLPPGVYWGTGSSSAAPSSFSSFTQSTSSSASTWIENSKLPFFAAMRGAIISTSTSSVMQANLSVWQNSKWNEAGREDPVSVDQ